MSNQLIKTTELGKENVFPRTRILDLFDETSGLKLIDILNSFNMMFVPYLGNKSQTRNQIFPELRRQGLWLTYVIDNTVYTEWYDEVAIDDTNWGIDANWRQGSNALVGDLSVSPNGTWVINGEDSGITIKGDKGDSPVIRIYDNKILVSYDKGVTYEDLNNTPIYTKFRFNSLTNTYLVSYDLGTNWQDISDEKVYHKFRYNNTTNTYLESIDFGKTWSNISAEKVYYLFRTNDNRLLVSTDLGTTWENCSEPIAAWFRWADASGTGNVGKVLISRDNKTWSDLSPTITNNLYIKGYVATVEELPTSSAAIGDIYMVGPTYDESDTTLDYPHYRMWVKLSSGWVDNGEFTNAGPVSTNNIIDGAVTSEKLADSAISKAMTEAISNEAQARAKADEKLNTVIVAEKNRAEAAEANISSEVAKKIDATNFNNQLQKKADKDDVTASIIALEKKIGERTEIAGDVVNNPDEEDLTQQNNKLMLKNRAYEPLNFSGKGYEILRKNMAVISISSATITVISAPTTDGYISVIVDGIEIHIDVTSDDTVYYLCERIASEIERNFDKFTVTYTDTTVELTGNYEFTISDVAISAVDTGATFGSTINEKIQRNINLLTQDMMTKENTVYVLRYDYELNNAAINIPANSVLEFRGGKISNGQINFANTHIAAYNNVVFSNVYFSGFFTNESVKISWFTNGMSSKSDYSNNHAKILKSAMQMATLLNKWVDLEKLPLLIKGEVFLDEKYGNCGLRNGNIYFISEKENDCTLRYVQTEIYSGSYAPIIDTIFQYIGDGNGNLHANVSCIYKDNWSDTVFTYWRDIRCFGYTGYFMVNTTYLQEVTFTNIYLSSTFGFITYNTQGIWGDKKGTSNIVKFLNCNLNNTPKRIKPKKSEAVKYIWDFYQPMEILLENIVNQGRISDEVGEEITVIRIEGNHDKSVSSSNRVNCVLNGFWIEYTSGNTYNNIILENTNVYLTLKKRNCTGVDVRGICRGVINFEQALIQDIVSFLNNVLIEDLENTRLSININASLKAIWFNLTDNAIDLIERGIIRVLNFYVNNWREASVNVNITPAYKFDVKKYLLSLIKPTLQAGRGHTSYITNENNVTILCYENNSATGYSDYTPLWSVQQYLLGRSIKNIDFIREVIYRATLTVDVTEDNINDIKCGFVGFINPSEGLPVYVITPEVGMKAGTTTGWVRSIYCGYSSHTKLKLNLRYARIEIAKMVITSGTTLIGNDDVLFNSDDKTIMRRNVMPETYYIGVDSKNDNEAYMNNIIKNAPIQDIFVTDKNVYRWNGSKIKNVANNSGETSERPVNIDNGTSFYDTTLNKPIWWNGTSWVDANGTTV